MSDVLTVRQTPTHQFGATAPDRTAAGLGDTGLRIISLNLAGATDVARIRRELSEIADLDAVDLLLLQETEYARFGTPRSILALAETLGMEAKYAKEKPNREGTAMALAILSPHRLTDRVRGKLKTFNRFIFQRERIALAVTAHTPLGSVRVVNLHLDTRINAHQRREQLESALDLMKGFSGPMVIGGDFNTADVKWHNQLIPEIHGERPAQVLKLRLNEEGFHTPFDGSSPTLRFLFWEFQLDWIFVSGLETNRHETGKVAFSDHRAVLVECRVPSSPRY